MENKSKLFFFIVIILSVSSCGESRNAVSNSNDSILQGKILFEQNCTACHRVDQDITGPALGCIGNKHSREWLYLWITDSKSLIDSGDEEAIFIFKEYNEIPHGKHDQLSNEKIDDIINYLDESCKE